MCYCFYLDRFVVYHPRLCLVHNGKWNDAIFCGIGVSVTTTPPFRQKGYLVTILAKPDEVHYDIAVATLHTHTCCISYTNLSFNYLSYITLSICLPVSFHYISLFLPFSTCLVYLTQTCSILHSSFHI